MSSKVCCLSAVAVGAVLLSLAFMLTIAGLRCSAAEVAPAAVASQHQQVGVSMAAPNNEEESYQRVYEAFTRLIASVSNNSLGNARRLVSRLNQLVGGEQSAAGSSSSSSTVTPPGATRQQQQQQQQPTTTPTSTSSADEKTDQMLTRLDQVTNGTDPHTLRQLNDDLNRLVGTLNESYLRNIRRLIERIERALGTSAPRSNLELGAGGPQQRLMFQAGQQLDTPRRPGFPGWDELIGAVDRVQKDLADFVRSSTKLITAGRR